MLMEGALLLPSFAVSLAYSDGMAVAFLITFAIVLVLGLPLVLLLKPQETRMYIHGALKTKRTAGPDDSDPDKYA